ncbi:sigma factor-like helix-turn-helix DNA-binding protein [Metabacillus bambusae]|uniref:Sigma-70 family RNA polymerase sigma factor n=1 Tax=Metabacillus bambusae TaxID=2795218 RepID=A0ABS3NC12_9BACI|nr:sigma factor-like helix-turn-helix DNA-binding protein [Metabacillus bambusae]MBO1515591.1 sigma-70 family RNA polymerase sigma factor [Metabacillus bambusae]
MKVQEQIEQLIRDYHWMRKEVDRLERVLYGYSTPMKSWGVAQYGIDAAMPKGSSGKSQSEIENMDIREERLLKRMWNLQGRVFALESAADYLSNEMEKIVYDCMLDGMSYRAIGYHLDISREKVRQIKIDFLNQLCQNCHLLQLLKLEKIAV